MTLTMEMLSRRRGEPSWARRGRVLCVPCWSVGFFGVAGGGIYEKGSDTKAQENHAFLPGASTLLKGNSQHEKKPWIARAMVLPQPLASGAWADHLPILSLSFPIYKMGPSVRVNMLDVLVAV